MALQKNKPVLFSISHELIAVEAGIDLFKKTLKGKKVLFIEFAPLEIAQALKGEFDTRPQIFAYQRLVAEAGKAGVEVVGLDTKKSMEELIHLVEDIKKTDNRKRSYIRKHERYDYLIYNKREKRWLQILKTYGSEAILVMHPGHAIEIAKKLRIPKRNIVGQFQDRKGQRSLAAKEAARIKIKKAARNKKTRPAGQRPIGYARRVSARKRQGK